MNEKYKKIINLPHYVSKKRQPMSPHERAAQFAPYSALSGYEDAVEETARLTDRKIELDDYEKEKIDMALSALVAADDGVAVKITFFRPDGKKQGGSYITIKGEIGRIDEHSREITLVGGAPISIDDILEVERL